MFMGPKYSVLYFKENLMQRKNQMNDRLQKMLLKKYALTKNQRYPSFFHSLCICLLTAITIRIYPSSLKNAYFLV